MINHYWWWLWKSFWWWLWWSPDVLWWWFWRAGLMESCESPCQSRLPTANKSFQIKFTLIIIIVIVIAPKYVEYLSKALNLWTCQTFLQMSSNLSYTVIHTLKLLTLNTLLSEYYDRFCKGLNDGPVLWRVLKKPQW